MTKEELISKLSFVSEETTKFLNVYVTAGGDLQLFNIEQRDLDELLPFYIDVIKTSIINVEELRVGSYSTSTARENMVYQYDLDETTRTQEMNNMALAGTQVTPTYFTCDSSTLERINGIYAVINDGTNRLVMYKQVSPVDKTYGRTSFLFGCKHDNSQFERKRYSMLRITPGMQMLFVDGEIILVDMQKLEKSLGLDAILQKESEAIFKSISDKEIMETTDNLKQVCTKPSMLKKLRHALQESKTKDLSNSEIVEYAKNQHKLKFKFNADGTKFNLDSKASAERFIKLLDDDYLISQLTNTEYDSEQKGELKEVVE